MLTKEWVRASAWRGRHAFKRTSKLSEKLDILWARMRQSTGFWRLVHDFLLVSRTVTCNSAASSILSPSVTKLKETRTKQGELFDEGVSRYSAG